MVTSITFLLKIKTDTLYMKICIYENMDYLKHNVKVNVDSPFQHKFCTNVDWIRLYWLEFTFEVFVCPWLS